MPKRNGYLDEAWRAIEALERRRARIERSLRCAECGRADDGRRGWTLRVDCDDQLAAFCPECDESEFGDA
jgi:hypothetical protein